MIKKIRYLFLISITTTAAAFGMGYLTFFFFQLEISDFTTFINGISAALILCATFIAIAIYTFFSAIKMVFVKPIQITSIKVQ